MVDLVSPGMGVSRDDVLTAYDMFLDRQPEDEFAISWHMQFPSRRTLADHMLGSEEFRQRTQVPPAPANDQVYAGYAPHQLGVFEHFPPYAGPGSPSFVTNFLGVRVRTSFSTPLHAFDGYVEGYPVPVGGVQGETAEFIGTLRSVLDAGDRYALLECGAGYGPWMAMAAAAAGQRGISDLRLYGIEGDAGHYKFMSEHLDDNGVGPESRTLIHGAVGAVAGTARWAVVDNAADVYGGRPMEDGPTDYHGTPQSRLIEVEVHSINDLLQREPVWDLVHVDIQGGEGALCRAGIEAMNQRVRRVVIGTHSRALDGEVMSVFHAADWVLENEKPTIMVWREGAPTLETMARVDGVQVWRNPRLVGAPAT
ncbi:MAG TPA: FkbM family methyltransferase [Acetobacteraceae bacterium]